MESKAVKNGWIPIKFEKNYFLEMSFIYYN